MEIRSGGRCWVQGVVQEGGFFFFWVVFQVGREVYFVYLLKQMYFIFFSFLGFLQEICYFQRKLNKFICRGLQRYFICRVCMFFFEVQYLFGDYGWGIGVLVIGFRCLMEVRVCCGYYCFQISQVEFLGQGIFNVVCIVFVICFLVIFLWLSNVFGYIVFLIC